MTHSISSGRLSIVERAGKGRDMLPDVGRELHREGFAVAHRVMTNIVADAERRCLVWLAARMPSSVHSDHLTALALLAMLVTGVAYALARFSHFALLLAILGLALNWFGDSLDGTLARVRQQQRPRYGFYVDHVLDCFGMLFLMAGLALSGYMTPVVAMGFLAAYFALSIEVYLATYCLATFRMAFWGVGPTELRVLLAIGTLALFSDPRVGIFGHSYRLFDVGGVIGMVGMSLTLIMSAVRNGRALYEAEPLRAARSWRS